MPRLILKIKEMKTVKWESAVLLSPKPQQRRNVGLLTYARSNAGRVWDQNLGWIVGIVWRRIVILTRRRIKGSWNKELKERPLLCGQLCFRILMSRLYIYFWWTPTFTNTNIQYVPPRCWFNSQINFLGASHFAGIRSRARLLTGTSGNPSCVSIRHFSSAQKHRKMHEDACALKWQLFCWQSAWILIKKRLWVALRLIPLRKSKSHESNKNRGFWPLVEAKHFGISFVWFTFPQIRDSFQKSWVDHGGCAPESANAVLVLLVCAVVSFLISTESATSPRAQDNRSYLALGLWEGCYSWGCPWDRHRPKAR